MNSCKLLLDSSRQTHRFLNRGGYKGCHSRCNLHMQFCATQPQKGALLEKILRSIFPGHPNWNELMTVPGSKVTSEYGGPYRQSAVKHMTAQHTDAWMFLKILSLVHELSSSRLPGKGKAALPLKPPASASLCESHRRIAVKLRP